MNNIGVVVIGRNEGRRLETCLHSLLASQLRVVYVDSGSDDGSVEFVKSQGLDVVELDLSIPFSAARARNEGYRFLIQEYPSIDFIQFVDGDCELCSGWMTQAYNYLLKKESLAAVCGRRKERYPEKTIYNRLCDIEWETPIGSTKSTGGDFMCRKQALLDVGGFAAEMIAGEEPELCFRMRELGWKIERLDLDMTWHDADMTRVSQWWKRNERSGHAYAQGFCKHGMSVERYCLVDLLRILVWALVLPIFIIALFPFVGLWAGVLIVIYPLKIIQVFMAQKGRFTSRIGLVYSMSLMFGKFPQLKGVVSFFMKHFLGKQLHIIEYKK